MQNYSVLITARNETDTIKQNGIFISHSREDEDLLDKLADAIRDPELKLEPLYDKERVIAGDAFKSKIEKLLRCRAAVLLLSDRAINSKWVEYELGFLEGRGTKVFIWDPDRILSSTALGGAEALERRLANVHLFRHMPAISQLPVLKEQLKKYRMYAGLLGTEIPPLGVTPPLTEEERMSLFGDRFRDHVKTVEIKLSSKRLRGQAELFHGCKFGTLVVNFGYFPKNAEKKVSTCCAIGGSPSFTEEELSRGAPPCSKKDVPQCARYGIREQLSRENAECLLLNHIVPVGRFVTRGESGTGEAALSFYVPVHDRFGTTFKLIVDPPNAEVASRLRLLFSGMGLSPTVSDSRNSLRIYLSMQDEFSSGLFRLNKTHFHNNYLCPHVLSATE